MHWQRRCLKNLQKRPQLWINTEACLISTGTAYGQAFLKIRHAAVRWLNRCQARWKIRTPLWGLSTSEKTAQRTAADALALSQQGQAASWRAASRIGLTCCGGRKADASWQENGWQENLPKRYVFHVGILCFIWSNYRTSLFLTSCICNALIIMISFTTFIWWLCISVVWNGANCWPRRSKTSELTVATWDYSGSQKRELYCNLDFLIPWQNKTAHLSPRLCRLVKKKNIPPHFFFLLRHLLFASALLSPT